MNPEDITNELRDIKPALNIVGESSLSPYAIVGIVLAVLLLLAAVGWWLRKRRRANAPIDPVSLALEQLDATRSLIETASSDAYTMAVSNVLRHYIERQFNTAAVSQTTDEFLVSLASDVDSPIRAHRESLRSFLRQCDLVKFARDELDSNAREQLFASARNFIATASLAPDGANDAPAAVMPEISPTATQASP